MYIKRFKLGHLVPISDWDVPRPGFSNDELPALGWVVIEHEEVLAYGFFREVEGSMMAVEGPYLKPDKPRAVEAGRMLEKHFMSEAMDRNVDLVRLKTYKP